MNDFNPTEVSLAIITYYPKWYRGKLRSIKHTDKVRGDLALEFFSKATKLGYKVVVADGKSSKTFKKAVSGIQDLIFIRRRKFPVLSLTAIPTIQPVTIIFSGKPFFNLLITRLLTVP